MATDTGMTMSLPVFFFFKSGIKTPNYPYICLKEAPLVL